MKYLSVREKSLTALRQARAVEAVDTLQKRSADQVISNLSMDDIDAEIRAARNSRVSVAGRLIPTPALSTRL